MPVLIWIPGNTRRPPWHVAEFVPDGAEDYWQSPGGIASARYVTHWRPLPPGPNR